jgi:hypothetical protein
MTPLLVLGIGSYSAGTQLHARPSADCSLCFGLHLFGFEGFALVMKLFTLRGSDLNFDPPTFQVQLGRNDGQAFLAGLGPQLVDFRTVQQQFALSGRRVVHDIAVRVLADMRVEQPQLVIIHLGIAFFQLDLPAFCRFYFRSGQHDPRFEAFQQVKIVPGRPVIAQDFKVAGLVQSDDSKAKNLVNGGARPAFFRDQARMAGDLIENSRNSARSALLSRLPYKLERKAPGAKHLIWRKLRLGDHFSRTHFSAKRGGLDRFVLVV